MIHGEYFEAGTSLGETASLDCQNGSLLLTTGSSSQTFDAETAGVSQRLAQLPRRIHFPDGSMFSTPQNVQVDALLKSLGHHPKSTWINYFEAGWHWTLLALLVIPFILFLLFTVGMPLVANPIASMVSSEIKNDLDQQAIEFLDEKVFTPSELGLERQKEISEKFSGASFYQVKTNVLFRGGGLLGANAFALPGGTIVFTDEIINLAENDGELVAVYIHEVGHVVGNHGLRNFIQTAGVSFVLGWMLGDLTMITDVVLVGAPVFLQRMAYSRKFEREADTYAMALLPLSGYSKNCFADMMEKLARQSEETLGDFPDYLSSHPPTRQRISMARSIQPCADQPPGTNANPPGPGKTVGVTSPGVITRIDIPPPDIAVAPGLDGSLNTLAGDSDYSPVSKAAPAYPRDALLGGIQGYCVVRYTVTSLGTVKDAVVVEEQCTNPLFEEPSIEASLQFRYKPRVVDSQAVDVTGVENKFTYEIMPYEPEDS